MKLKLAYLFSTSLMILAAIGCGPSGPQMARVSGKVLLDGMPIPDGHVIFRSTNGQVVSAAGQVVNGEYTLEAIPGEKTVQIIASRDVPGKFDQSNPGEKVQITEQYIPVKYNEESTLTIVVDADGTHDFDLKSS